MSRSSPPPKRAFPNPIEKLRALLAGWRGKSETLPVSRPDEIQEQFAKIAAAAMDAIIAVNSRQQIILFNPAAEAMFGLPAPHALGQPLNILIPDRFREPHVEHLDRFMARGATARRMGALGKLLGLRANGEEFPIEASIAGMTSKGGGIYVVIIRDITERVRLEEQLRSFIDHAPAATVRLRIYLGEDDKYKGRPLYEEIVVQAQQSRLAGVTVFRGYLGYGAASGLNPGKILRSSHDLPVVVEILESEGKVNAFLEVLDQLLSGGVATIERVNMFRYSRQPRASGTPKGS